MSVSLNSPFYELLKSPLYTSIYQDCTIFVFRSDDEQSEDDLVCLHRLSKHSLVISLPY